MRVLLISDAYGYMQGGVPEEARQLISGLAARGHAVALASDVPLGAIEESLHFPVSLPVGESLAREVGLALEGFRPDFVHVLCMSSKGLMRIAPLLEGHAWALTVHSVPPYERKLGMWHGHEGIHYAARALRYVANSTAWRWVFRRGIAPRVIVHSEYVRDIVLSYGCAENRLTLIPLAFNGGPVTQPVISAPRSGDAPLLLTTVGGFAHTKGQHDVVKALPMLIKHFPRLRYQVIGEVRDPSYLDYLGQLARRLDVSEHLLTTPNLSQQEKQARLSASDAYVQPSHEEGFCLAFAEAAAVVPRLVAANTGAMASIARRDPGARVVPICRPNAIAAAVCDLFETELPDNHMQERALRLTGMFSPSRYLEAHEVLYAQTR